MNSPRRKIVDRADAAAWRRAASDAQASVALLCGRFEMLHPGNLGALQQAARAASRVVVLLDASAEPGVEPSAYAPAQRAAFVSHLRDVSAVILADAGDAGLLRDLRPFTWVMCPAIDAASSTGRAIAPHADARVEIPLLPDCRTRGILQAIRAGHTPVDVSAYDAPGGASGRDGPAYAPGLARVTVNGCFDVLHLGHASFLERARALGDWLTVLINDDASVRRYKGQARPVFPFAFRRAALMALASVAEVVSFDGDTPLDALARLRPRVHVKGGSYVEERVREERERVESWGGRLEFCPMVGDYSTTAFIRKHADAPE